MEGKMPNTVASITDTQAPKVRNFLKAKVFEVGYPTFADFADKLGIHRVYLSKIVNGHEWPSPNVQRKLAAELGLTLKELRELL
jgi:transcriptional regulator with XRE-family HTH domain